MGQHNPPGTCTGAVSLPDWTAALAVAVTANGSSHRSHTDWRLPNRTELYSLVKIDASSPAIDTTVFPNTPSYWFWTSTTYAPDSASAWLVGFGDGDTGADNKTGTVHVRLVRSGQLFGSFDALDTTTPVLSSVGASGTTTTATTLSTTSDEAATGYWIVVARAATAPNAAQVKAAATYLSVTIVASGNSTMTANIAKTFSVTSLVAGTDYDLYFAAEDGSGNLSAAATQVQFSSAAATTPPVLGDVPNQTPTVGTAFSLDLSGYVTPTDGNAIVQYRLASGSLPTGLSLNTATGVISGTPSLADTFNVTVQAQDADGWSNSDAITFTVADTTPDAFDIPNLSNQTCSTAVTTSQIAVAGIDTSVTASITVGTVVKNGTDTGLTSTTVSNGDTVAVKLSTSGSYSTAVNGTLTIGTVSDNFSVTTESAPADTTPEAFTWVDQINIALSTATESAAITVAGINTAATISITGGEYQIGSGSWTSTAGTVNNGDSVKVRHTSSASYSTQVDTVLSIGGISDTFSTTTQAAPAPAPGPEPTPAPVPTEVVITGPGQSIVAAPGLPVRIAPGTNVDGASIAFPAGSPITLDLGGTPLTVTAQGSGAQFTLHTLSVGGQSVIVIAIGSGSANIESQSAGQYLLVFGSGQTLVQAGNATTRFTVQSNGSGVLLLVRQGTLVLATGSLAGNQRRTASADFPVYAGEQATLDASGRVTRIALGTGAGVGDAAGDPLTLSLPDNLTIQPVIPKLDVSAARLGKTVEQAIADSIHAEVALGQNRGVIGFDLDGTRLYALPLGEISIDPSRADGTLIGADGLATFSKQGLTVKLAPSVANPIQLARDVAVALPGATLTLTHEGLLVASHVGQTYVVRPDWLAMPQAGQVGGFTSDAAGRLSYQQNLHSFVLNPAFADFAKLAAAVQTVLPGATATTNADGSVTVTAGENRWTLTPVNTIEAAPVGQSAWWTDAAGRFWLKNGDGTVQEFRVE